MKYGLIIFSKTDNLGDDIQSYATKRYLPHVDYLIERENLNEFTSDDNHKVAVIMAGWFLYEHLNWPPSPFIYPLSISMHFDTYYSRYLGKPLEENMVLEGYGAKWLNDNGPVGARDYFTLNLLSGFGIKSYFSGCITTTLKKFSDVSKNNSIVAVDVNPSIVKKIASISNKNIISKTHKIQLESFSMEERFHFVEEHLKLYQSASLVITSRLHAALPCLAFETPVLFVKDIKFFNRIATFMPYFHSEFEDNILKPSFTYDFDNPPDNPISCHQMQASLESICINFIKHCEDMKDIYVSSKLRCEDANARLQHLQIYNERNNLS